MGTELDLRHPTEQHLRRFSHRVWEYFHRWRGRYLFENGTGGANPYGAQCVNVANEWLMWLGLPMVGGNAADFCDFESAQLRNHPRGTFHRLYAGDLAVFGASAALPFGHVGVVLDGSREPYAAAEQNWPLGSVVHENFHALALVDCALRPVVR